MLLALLVVIPSLLATWVSYWSTNLFGSLSNRPSRVITLISPTMIAAATGIILTVSGTDIEIPDLSGRHYVAEALLLALTALLIILTLLLALFAGKLFKHPQGLR